MSTSKSRKTQIQAHVSKKVLQSKFPDTIDEKWIYIDEPLFDRYGDPLESRISYCSWSAKDQALTAALDRAGISYRIEKETKQYDGYIKVELEDGKKHDLQVIALSERKTAVVFNSSMDEADHYEVVDKIVKALADKDVAVLRGECEITITTRC